MSWWNELDESVAHNRRCLKHWFPAVNDGDAEDYAKLVWLLSNRQQFAIALERLSADIWERYLSIAAENRGDNRLTRAIRMVGQEYSFRSFLDDNEASSHVVYINQLSPEKFLANLQDKILFKDSFGRGHGEFSHSYQWLAAGKYFSWQTRTADLYAGATVLSSEPLWQLGDREIVQKRAALWSWLVDCVTPFEDKRSEMSDEVIRLNGYIFTDNSFRFANNVQQFLESKEDWFIGYCAKYRTERLKAIATATEAKYRPPGASKGAMRRAIVGQAPPGVTRYRELVGQQVGLRERYSELVDEGHGTLADGIYRGAPRIDIVKSYPDPEMIVFHDRPGVITRKE